MRVGIVGRQFWNEVEMTVVDQMRWESRLENEENDVSGFRSVSFVQWEMSISFPCRYPGPLGSVGCSSTDHWGLPLLHPLLQMVVRNLPRLGKKKTQHKDTAQWVMFVLFRVVSGSQVSKASTAP